MKALYALYSDPDAAQRAVNALKSAGGALGIGEGQIVVVTGEPFDGYDFSDEHSQTHIFLLASIGGIMGAILGYLLTRFTQLSYPLNTGGMPIVTSWTNGIIIYEMAMLGAIVWTLATLLIAGGLPHFGQSLSDPAIWHGKILVGVTDPPASSRSELEKHFRLAGPAEIKSTT
jgi:predicted RND superfamily exporter protein